LLNKGGVILNYKGHILRHELKYYINYQEYTYLKNRIKNILNLDENATEGIGYHIRSLYFDDIYNSALEEKLSGVLKRKKYRIRIYDELDKVIKLECKEKYGEYISKTSTNITREQFYDIIFERGINFLLEKEKQVANNFFIDTKTRLLKPAVITDYCREAYILDAGNVRITFDKNLKAGINSPDIFSPELITVSAMPQNMMILEIKYDGFLPKYIRQLLKISKHDRSAISKFVICRLLQFKLNPVSHSIFNNWTQSSYKSI